MAAISLTRSRVPSIKVTVRSNILRMGSRPAVCITSGATRFVSQLGRNVEQGSAPDTSINIDSALVVKKPENTLGTSGTAQKAAIADLQHMGDTDRSAVELPSLPETPPYPCPYLDDVEIVEYLEPLYSCGWYVGSSRDVKFESFPRAAPELVKRFRFTKQHRSLAMQFVRDINEIQIKEDHHATLVITQGVISVRTHTHSARPRAVSDSAQSRKNVPGVTLRDVRLAMLIEKAFRPYLDRHDADSASQKAKDILDMLPTTVQQMEARRR
ncbi:uncharacterized protein LAESUDRAFT_762696 [Laetiporus sulphureus 93-53]|uniref:4a-hydroxytetrahydrobiopterin dehydratase n=1 Tax=Laetiporus sulphureus 93-53 TaxID=1314785 RepID=A0A165CCM5_9APHY|nr:uncharacterized protein LAESUDRAFT_762696 [Laetiporus sulphureus 93-53]KZT02569.1 hypothetical protein LAESUDRAFT_762696 [Laetiporus sulphureus 93-53]